MEKISIVKKSDQGRIKGLEKLWRNSGANLSYIAETTPGRFYIVEKVNGKNKYLRRATEVEVRVYRQAKAQLQGKDVCWISCDYPECDKLFPILRSQKRELNVLYPLKYKEVSFNHCSTACRDKHKKELGIGNIP